MKRKTLLENWEHFEDVDLAPDAPAIQRDEMMRAFYAGASSACAIIAQANIRDGDAVHKALERMLVEQKAFLHRPRSIMIGGESTGGSDA